MTVTKNAAAPQFRTECITNWCIWKQMTSWWVDAAAADPHSEHRDRLMLESPRTMWWVLCKEWRYWKIWLEYRKNWWALILANLFLLCASLSWPPWLACSLQVSLLLSCVALNPRILAIWIRGIYSTLSGPMYCTLSPTVFKCTTCQQSKSHQRNRFFSRGQDPYTLACKARPPSTDVWNFLSVIVIVTVIVIDLTIFLFFVEKKTLLFIFISFKINYKYNVRIHGIKISTFKDLAGPKKFKNFKS